MATALTTRQAVLTRALNRLTANIRKCEELENMVIEPPSEGESRRAYLATQRQKLEKSKILLESEISNVSRALEQYSSTADDLDPQTPSLADILQKVNANVETATQHMDTAYSILTTIEVFLQELGNIERKQIEFFSNGSPDAPQTNLAPIPIPKFSGRIWDWDTFWGAFEHSVHSRQMDDLYKLNYLLDALQGEARETVKQFQISRGAYPLVVEHLKRKYGDTQVLVEQLIQRLHNLRALSERLDDQEKLCEQLSSIVAQLHLKGENVNNVFLQRQLLGKFTEDIQRQVLRKKEQESPESNWDTTTLLAAAKSYIAMELKIRSRTNKRKEDRPTVQSLKGSKRDLGSNNGNRKAANRGCFYCSKQDHSPTDCKHVTTREERLEVIRKGKLCHNCGSKDHMVGQCTKGPCRICQQHGHHTSVCRQLFSPPMKPSAAQDVKTVPQTKSKATPKRSQTLISSKVNTTLSGQGQTQDVVPSTAVYVNHHRVGTNVHILVGQAQVLNPSNQALETVHVMLDTGADRSFISTQLADHLELRDIKSVELTISTFGSQQPLKRICGVTELQMWDAQGKAHKVTVTKIDTITEPMERSSLSNEDKQFLYDHNMTLSISSNVTDIYPQVLLGCADLYSFLDKGLTAETSLPSGLKLIPSKLGYLVSGRGSNHNDALTEESREVVEFGHSSMEPEDEPQSWADFCTFESSGVHEFVGPNTQERKTVEAEVWECRDPDTWPEESRLFTLPTEDCDEQICMVARATEETSELLDWSRHNRLTSAKRTMAYVLRFLHNISLRVNVKFKERLEKAIPELSSMTSEPFITAAENRMALQVLEIRDNPVEPDSTSRYELRPRKLVNYNEDTAHCATAHGSTSKNIPIKFLLTCTTALMLATGVTPTTTAVGQMSCIPGGLSITTRNIEQYEVCAEHLCYVKEQPQGNETIHLPPEILLHKHDVQLKLFDGQNLTVLETSCPPESFCDHIRCWFCTANIFNPECSPRTAITALTITLYISIALLYALCYVPMVFGKPCRIVAKALWSLCKAIGYLLWKICKRPAHRGQRYDVEALLRTPLLAIVCTTMLATRSFACQDIDPSIPFTLGKMRITLTSLSFLPTPTLASSFISDGSQIAIWAHKETPPLFCESEDQARSLNCSVTTDCDCEPAEDKVNCMCTDFKVTNVFSNEIENRLPIRRPWITFTTTREDPTTVVALIPSFITAEILIHLREEFDKTVRMVTDSICTVPNSIAKGCYLCPQGAFAEITCNTEDNPTMATITCDDQSFTIPCKREGATSTLRFTHKSARLMKRCKVSCGSSEKTFEITGILQWIRTIHGSTLKVISGESSVYDELVFRILDIFLMSFFTAMEKYKKTPSATSETDVSTTRPPAPKATSQTKSASQPKRLNPTAKSVAPAGSVAASTSKRKRDTSSSSSSSTEETSLPPKKGRASGSMLKELLQQGSRVLQFAASKVDQLAPAVTVSSSQETTERLDRLEQLMKSYHEQNVKMHKSNEAKLEKLDSKVNILTARLNQLEKEAKEHTQKARETTTSDQSNEELWSKLQGKFELLREEISSVNKLAFDIRYIHESFEELNSRLSNTNTGPAEPSSELDRIRHQMRETERELNAARDATRETDQSIEKELTDKGRVGSSRTMEELKDRRRSCQSRESRLEREMRDLQARLERETRRRNRPTREQSQEQQGMRRERSDSPHESRHRERTDKRERRRSSASRNRT
ncbi:zinc knuckle [Ostertagia ostertagi]